MNECSPRFGHHYHNDPREKVILPSGYLSEEVASKLDQIQESYLELLHDRLIEEITVGLSLDTDIYRIERLDYFLRSLCEKELWLTNPCNWDDPWENFILRNDPALPDGSGVDGSALRDSFFAQCWSLSPECEGLWKVRYFDPGNRKRARGCDKPHRFVKIQTKIRSLMREVYKIENTNGHDQFQIGLVRYVSPEAVKSQHETSMKDPSPLSWRRDIVKSLLTKRAGFEYEQEVRLIFCEDFLNKGIVKTVRNGVSLPNIDYRNFLKGVEIDPWCSDSEFEEIKQRLEMCRVLGVSQSTLRSAVSTRTVLFGDECMVLSPSTMILPRSIPPCDKS